MVRKSVLIFESLLMFGEGLEFFGRWQQWIAWRKQRLQELHKLMSTAALNVSFFLLLLLLNLFDPEKIHLSKVRVMLHIWHRYD